MAGTAGSFSSGNSITFNFRSNTSSSCSFSRRCNESEKYDNDEKALYHGLKNAYRMGQPYDGKEYGSDKPQYDHAAHVAAHVALAYFKATGATYGREESHDYLEEKGLLDANKSVFRSMTGLVIDYGVPDGAFTAAIKQAWLQIDKKHHHDDAARTALAIAERYLDTEFEVA